jgi:hypothetical protein
MIELKIQRNEHRSTVTLSTEVDDRFFAQFEQQIIENSSGEPSVWMQAVQNIYDAATRRVMDAAKEENPGTSVTPRALGES